MNNVIIYDKAKYHYEGNFPVELDRMHAFVHIGMFLGWACTNDLLSEQMLEDFASEISQFQRRNITGTRLIELCGGALASDMLNDAGNAFTSQYYEFKYLDDYVEVLLGTLPSIYHIEDRWENFDRMKLRINERYHGLHK